MDFAQRLAGLKEQSPEQWVTLANRFLPGLAAAALVLAIAYQLSGLTWAALARPALDAPIAAPAPGRNASTPARATGSYPALDDWKPFGEPPDPTAQEIPIAVLDAPDTTLNLQLWGVHGGSDPETGDPGTGVGAAFISSGRADQKLYYVGETIEGANGARLHSVFYDRVLLDRGGRLETLRLPLELEPVASMQRPGPTGGSALPQVQPAESLRDVISDNAARFAEVVRIVPDLQGGQMNGFRLTPGRDREAFAELGLEPGDVMTEVNGILLNDTNSAAQVFQALGEASMANVTIMRGGNPQVFVLDMSKLQSMTENQQ